MTPSEYRKKLAKETARAILKDMKISTGDSKDAIKYARAGAKVGSVTDKMDSKKCFYSRKDNEGR